VLARIRQVVAVSPKVGAVCGKAARTDLCGGREVTRVPTAKPNTPWQTDCLRDLARIVQAFGLLPLPRKFMTQGG